ncbi:MAG TPA: hypothetical protein VM533_00020 [Fimbriiglobus sp.]|jgi:hypothetical protein|nr:hypothetical protein [Fimbriiglobus sp.]
MRIIELTETGEPDFLAGSDGAYYTPAPEIEAECDWCGWWGHPVGLYHRQELYRPGAALVCGRHVRLDGGLQVT